MNQFHLTPGYEKKFSFKVKLPTFFPVLIKKSLDSVTTLITGSFASITHPDFIAIKGVIGVKRRQDIISEEITYKIRNKNTTIKIVN